ncbi:MAG: D-alanyl-lipoteichoic acid biosynthesis protein DltD [Mycobacterium leprae]
MKRPHLLAAVLAFAAFAGALVAGELYADRVERQYVHALAAAHFDQKNQGSVLQRAAFQEPDLLPIYGSSELTIPNPYHGSEVFKEYPTGFTIFPVGKAGTTDLIILQDLAAAGELKGKKVAISLSAPWFFGKMQSPESYAGNFSALHAEALAWDTQLPFALKHEIALRLLDYPNTLTKEPLLHFALNQLARGGTGNRLLYYASLPLGKLQIAVLQLQDHWETLKMIKAPQKKLPAATPPVAGPVDWSRLLTQATTEQQQHANNNPFGFDNQIWQSKLKNETPKQPAKNRDLTWMQGMWQSKEWTDLDLLLRSLKAMGAEPIIFSMPIQGPYYDYTGVSAWARQAYYTKLQQVTRPYSVPVLMYADHDEDKYFLIDSGAHLSREGWIYYDKALDQFYHGTLK